MAAPDLDAAEISRLYEKYAADLGRVRKEEAELYQKRAYSPLERKVKAILPFTRGSWLWPVVRPVFRLFRPTESYLYPAFDDIECEVTYLLIRARRPETVVEISPAGGWSTSWMLQAVKDNGVGTVFSFDLKDRASKILPPELREGRWAFSQGDVRAPESPIPDRIDFLFLDSLHTASFARWYIGGLFPRCAPGGTVVVDDVFPTESPLTEFVRKSDPDPTEGEPEVVLRWLSSHQKPFFTASPRAAPEVFQQLSRTRHHLGVDSPIHESEVNPAIFFTLNRE